MPKKEDKFEKVGVVKLSEPVEFEGEKISEVPYDFGKLKGRDLMEVARSVGGNPANKLMIAANFDVQCEVFARAAGRPIELLEQLDPSDLVAAALLAQLFLLASSAQK